MRKAPNLVGARSEHMEMQNSRRVPLMDMLTVELPWCECALSVAVYPRLMRLSYLRKRSTGPFFKAGIYRAFIQEKESGTSAPSAGDQCLVKYVKHLALRAGEPFYQETRAQCAYFLSVKDEVKYYLHSRRWRKDK